MVLGLPGGQCSPPALEGWGDNSSGGHEAGKGGPVGEGRGSGQGGEGATAQSSSGRG